MKKINKLSVIYSGTRKTDKILSSVKEIAQNAGSNVISSTDINFLNDLDKKKISKSDLILVNNSPNSFTLGHISSTICAFFTELVVFAGPGFKSIFLYFFIL